MNNVVLVFGSGRSGTSWLCETMARPKGYRLLFEPEHEDHVPEGRVLTDKLLIPGESYPDVDQFLNKLLKNRIDNDWIAQHSYRKYKMHLWPFLIKKKIVKFVRCNLSMHYITNKFKVQSVYIYRNPYSTIFSQNRVQFPWLSELKKFQQQPILCNALIEFYNFDICKEDFTILEKLAIRWSIENIFPFMYSKFLNAETEIQYIDYDLLVKNVTMYEELLRKLNFDAPENLHELFRSPSSKTHPKSNILLGKPANYENLFEPKALEEINGILTVFGYNNQFLPGITEVYE